jgi:hypothetical protein
LVFTVLGFSALNQTYIVLSLFYLHPSSRDLIAGFSGRIVHTLVRTKKRNRPTENT